MRPTPTDADDEVGFQTPPSPPCHDPRSCSWKPYSNSKDFEANAAVVLIILLCGLICALALNTAIRCFLRRSATHETTLPRSDSEPDPIPDPKPTPRVHTMKVVFSPDMKMKLAGVEPEAECTICLAEFSVGEEIQVLPICKHGFHFLCIQEWLNSNSSCPTCRRTYLSSSPDLVAADQCR